MNNNARTISQQKNPTLTDLNSRAEVTSMNEKAAQ